MHVYACTWWLNNITSLLVSLAFFLLKNSRFLKVKTGWVSFLLRSAVGQDAIASVHWEITSHNYKGTTLNFINAVYMITNQNIFTLVCISCVCINIHYQSNAYSMWQNIIGQNISEFAMKCTKICLYYGQYAIMLPYIHLCKYVMLIWSPRICIDICTYTPMQISFLCLHKYYMHIYIFLSTYKGKLYKG